MRPSQENPKVGRHLLTSGRSEQLAALYQAYSARVLAYALRRTTKEEAEDVVAETFIVAFRRVHDIPDDPIPWLLGVARRALANRRRAAGRRKALDQRLISTPRPIGALALDPAEEVAARLAVGEALDRLNERDREALLLVTWDGLDNRNAARVMNCSPATFALRLHRARRRFTEQFHKVQSNDPKTRAARVRLEEGK